MRVYVGTYTRGESKGIYMLELDLASGKLGEPTLVAQTTNPSFLAVHPSRKYLYSVSEVANVDGKKSGGVAAFSLDAGTGKLTELNRQASGGGGPCHVTVDEEGKVVLVANYGAGSVASLPIGDGGRLEEAASVIQHKGSSANPKRQEGPHAHSVNIDPANRIAVVADLGIDKLMLYRLDTESGKLAPNDPPHASVEPGSGPRHFAFHPDGRHAYVINELASTVTAFEYNPQQGSFRELQTISTLPEGFSGNNTTAEIQVHPSGKFLYGSNRGHNSIAAFAVDPKSGRLSALGHESSGGKTPRNFGIDPTGAWLLAANQDSDNIIVLRIDQQTGKLTPTGQSVNVGAPVCIKFVPPEAG